MPCEIKTEKEFDSILYSNDFVLMHFWAEWNSSDYLVKQILAELEAEFENKIVFASINVDIENLFDLFRAIPILNVPTLIFFKKGNHISTEVGFDSKKTGSEKERLKSKISEIINSTI